MRIYQLCDRIIFFEITQVPYNLEFLHTTLNLFQDQPFILKLNLNDYLTYHEFS
jgi:hypothetical protein